MSAEAEVQTAVYAALTGDATYMALVTGVYDGVAPGGATYPFTVLGPTTETDDGDLTDPGWSLTLLVSDWSEAAGRRECLDIREARDAVLHRQHLAVPGWGQVLFVREFGQVVVDVSTERTLRHGISRYRASAWTS